MSVPLRANHTKALKLEALGLRQKDWIFGLLLFLFSCCCV